MSKSCWSPLGIHTQTPRRDVMPSATLTGGSTHCCNWNPDFLLPCMKYTMNSSLYAREEFCVFACRKDVPMIDELAMILDRDHTDSVGSAARGPPGRMSLLSTLHALHYSPFLSACGPKKVVRPQRCLPAGLKVSNRYSCSRTHRTLGHGKGRPGFMCPMTEDLQGRLQTSYTLTAHRAKDTNNCPEGVHANNNGQHNNITLHNFIPFD